MAREESSTFPPSADPTIFLSRAKRNSISGGPVVSVYSPHGEFAEQGRDDEGNKESVRAKDRVICRSMRTVKNVSLISPHQCTPRPPSANLGTTTFITLHTYTCRYAHFTHDKNAVPTHSPIHIKCMSTDGTSSGANTLKNVTGTCTLANTWEENATPPTRDHVIGS